MSASAEPSPTHAAGGTDMSEGLMDIMKPAVERLDAQILATKSSQYYLNQSIQELAEYLKEVSNKKQAPFDLDVYVRKLDDSKKRIATVATLLQNLHERLGKLQRKIAREVYSQKQVITQMPPSQPSR
uniref:Biogenesis of lysosome-related organelles complex 1 subunit 7 n=1 Tax=Syphacia muris TaxID=451379 RepID=A0A0N5AVP1_9BILA